MALAMPLTQAYQKDRNVRVLKMFQRSQDLTGSWPLPTVVWELPKVGGNTRRLRIIEASQDGAELDAAQSLDTVRQHDAR
jgi:hypothetical protein